MYELDIHNLDQSDSILRRVQSLLKHGAYRGRKTLYTCPYTFRFRTCPLTGTASGMASDSVRGRGGGASTENVALFYKTIGGGWLNFKSELKIMRGGGGKLFLIKNIYCQKLCIVLRTHRNDTINAIR